LDFKPAYRQAGKKSATVLEDEMLLSALRLERWRQSILFPTKMISEANGK